LRAIVNILQNDTALVALLGNANKIGSNVIGHGEQTPYVVVDQEDTEPNNTFRSGSELDFTRITIFCVADLTFTSGSTIGADNLGEAVRNAIDIAGGIRGTYDGVDLRRCTRESGGQMQEDRIANKPQITREDGYLLVIGRSTGAPSNLVSSNVTQNTLTLNWTA